MNEIQQLPDINDAEGVEMEVTRMPDGRRVVYFNVNGITVLRAVEPKMVAFNGHVIGEDEK